MLVLRSKVNGIIIPYDPVAARLAVYETLDHETLEATEDPNAGADTTVRMDMTPAKPAAPSVPAPTTSRRGRAPASLSVDA